MSDGDPIYTPRRAPHAQQLTVRGVRTHVTRWGSAGTCPLVFLHGFLDTSDTFQFLVDAMTTDRSIAAPDWRGFGRSAWTGPAYWFQDYVADLDQLLDVLSPEQPATIVGHSMGGNVAGLYAGVRPERVRALVSLEGFGLHRTPPAKAPSRLREWLDEERAPPAYRAYPDRAAFAQQLRRRNPHLSQAQAAYLSIAGTRPGPEGGVVFNADPAHRRVNPVLYRREETEACWQACAAPVLMVLGGRSEFRASLGADATPEYFRQHFRDVQVADLPDAGHMLHQDAAAETARLIEEFLTRVGA